MTPPPSRRSGGARHAPAAAPATIARQLTSIERAGGDGELAFAGGATLHVSSLTRPYFPEVGLTKGGLMRYYARVADVLLPAIDARPLALKRYPKGVGGPSFFQHAPGAAPPAGTRVADVPVEGGGPEPRYVGGDLLTLLETVQLGTIAVNPWHSRVGALAHPDYCVLDLDPGPEAPFSRIVAVAFRVRAELEERGLACTVKTSGSRGLHILVPFPPGLDYALSAALAEDVAVRVAERAPAEATVERALHDRSPGQVYVDHMQNAHGKTLASVFSVRARPQATVSTPVTWAQLRRPRFDPAAFTVATVPRRLARLAALWRGGMATVNDRATLENAVRRR